MPGHYIYISYGFRIPNIEVSEFIDLAQRYRVQGVPKTVVHDRVEFVGALPEPRAIQQMLQALDQEKEE